MAKFKFKRRRRRLDQPPIVQSKIAQDIELLTGFVRGYNASDIEERFARALHRLDLGYWFQYKLETIHTIPGQEKRIDFIVFYMPGKIQPVEIYGDRWHETSGDKARDRAREIEINEQGKKFGWDPLKVVWGHELENQNMANNIARRMFI